MGLFDFFRKIGRVWDVVKSLREEVRVLMSLVGTLLKKLDLDGDGDFDLDDIRYLFRTTDIKTVAAELDVNGDKVISNEELAAVISNDLLAAASGEQTPGDSA